MFFIIGAPKGGTTALWQYLRVHPEISMPIDKEAPYFASDEMQRKGWDWYLKEFFIGKEQAHVYGTASPQYMSFPYSARNIYNMFPEAKIIVLLRDPIERAISHYKMMKRRGNEVRSFDSAISDQLKTEKLITNREYIFDQVNENDEINTYIAHGEYARILQSYVQIFPLENILFLTDKELLEDRLATYRKILKFIKVDVNFIPGNLKKEYHKGGNSNFQKVLSKITDNKILKSIAKLIIPIKYRKIISFRVATMNQKPEKLKLSGETYKQLKAHYEIDREWLTSIGVNSSSWMSLTGKIIEI